MPVKADHFESAPMVKLILEPEDNMHKGFSTTLDPGQARELGMQLIEEALLAEQES